MSSEASTAAHSERVRFAGATLPVYGATIFVAAALVFLVQPMAAKMLLPQFGGTPAVWAVSPASAQARSRPTAGQGTGTRSTRSTPPW
jgi:hypothetical protein